MHTKFRQISDTVRQSFTSSNRWEVAEFIILTMLTIALTIDWRGAMWLIAIFVLVSVVGHFAASDKPTENTVCRIPGIGRERWICYAMLAFYTINLIGALRSSNISCGLEDITTKLSLLIFPLLALLKLSPHRGCHNPLSRKHIRMLLYVLWASLLLQFFVWLSIAGIRFSQGTPIVALMGENFTVEHHSYLALFILVAMAFASSEILRQLQKNGQMSSWGWILFLGELVLTLFLVVMDSRAGIVVIVILALVVLVDYVATTHRWKGVVLFILLLAGGSVLTYQSLPREYRRFDNTIKRFKDGDPVDIRSQLAECVWEAAEGHWLLGLGNGDAQDELLKHYLDHDLQEAYDNNFGPHNQYLSTLLECGFTGVVLLFAMLLMPAIVAWRNHLSHRDGRPVYLIVLVASLLICFESMLGRASGVMFIAFIYYILTLWTQKTSALPSSV